MLEIEWLKEWRDFEENFTFALIHQGGDIILIVQYWSRFGINNKDISF